MIVQGQNDVTAGTETKNDFYTLKIVSYELPHNSSRVYTNVPQGARQVSLWTQYGTLNQSLYGWETTGPMSGKFFVDVPSSYSRNAKFTNTTANASAFHAPGSTFENVTYSSGALRLSGGNESGSFVSADIPVSGAFNILSGNLSLSGTHLGNVTSYLSNDGGVSWTKCENSTKFDFTGAGTVLKARFALSGNTTLGILPNMTSFNIVANFLPVTIVFTVHVSFLWTPDFTDRRTTIDLSEAIPYTSSGSFMVLLYALKGYIPQGVGFNLTMDTTGSMNTYPDKTLYLYSTSVVPSGGNISLVLTAPKADYSWVLYLAVGAVLITLLGFALLRRPIRARGKAVDEEVDDELPDEDNEARRKELVERKKSIRAEMEGLKGKESSAELKTLKRELKQVRNALNKLPKTGEIPAVPAEKLGTGASSKEPHDAALASIARLDDDFDKGRLSESTYRSLRKEYVSKATALMASMKKVEDGAESRLVAEKNKLMEAILALDDEREKGEIDAKVYGELRASYRKKLAELARELDGKREEE